MKGYKNYQGIESKEGEIRNCEECGKEFTVTYRERICPSCMEEYHPPKENTNDN